MKPIVVAIAFSGLFASVGWSQTQAGVPEERKVTPSTDRTPGPTRIPAPPEERKVTPWRNRVFGEAAGRLIATHPMNSELRELETILCPPNGTPRRTVEQVYGKPAKYDNIADFYFYDVSSRLSLCVLYHEEKVREGGFWHGKIRELEPSVNTVPGREIPSGPPLSYGDLLLDLQQKVDNLGDALATLQSKRVPIPWHPWRADAPNDPPHQ